MPPPAPSTLLAFVGHLVGTRRGATTVKCTTLVGYSSLPLLLAIAAITVLSQVQDSASVLPGTTVEASG